MRIRLVVPIIFTCMLAPVLLRADEGHRPDESARMAAGEAAKNVQAFPADQRKSSSQKKAKRAKKQKEERRPQQNQEDGSGAAYMNQVELRS